MKKITKNHKLLNNGKDREIYYPIADSEFHTQFSEIFDSGHYKQGLQGKDKVYVDLGANIGLTANYFAPYASKYYAVEPSKDCFEALKRNTKQLKNIELFNFAVFPRNGKEFLYSVAENSTPQTFFANKEQIKGKESVECKRIDTFFEENKIDHVDILKVDIESSEHILFPDTSFAKVADKIDFIIGEAHYALNGMIPEFIPLVLEQYGFKTKFTDSQNMKYNFIYRHQEGKIKKYEYLCNTMFVAEKK